MKVASFFRSERVRSDSAKSMAGPPQRSLPLSAPRRLGPGGSRAGDNAVVRREISSWPEVSQLAGLQPSCLPRRFPGFHPPSGLGSLSKKGQTMRWNRTWRSLLLLALASGAAQAQIKIGYIDPLSGLMAATGDHGLRELQFNAERINARGGILGQKIEVVAMDNKLSPQESLALLNRAVDEGIRYILQGNGSSVAAALIDGLNKHNARNPDKSVLFLNYAAVDPAFTNSKCSFWHFRFDANSDMKLQAIVNSMIPNQKIKKVYIIGQDYSCGHQVTKTAKELLKEKRPDVEIVGDELHPLAKVKDFSPYVAKIRASAADTVITGNWGSDLALLIRAAKDAGLKADFYTFYARVLGSPTAIGEAGPRRAQGVGYF